MEINQSLYGQWSYLVCLMALLLKILHSDQCQSSLQDHMLDDLAIEDAEHARQPLQHHQLR